MRSGHETRGIVEEKGGGLFLWVPADGYNARTHKLGAAGKDAAIATGRIIVKPQLSHQILFIHIFRLFHFQRSSQQKPALLMQSVYESFSWFGFAQRNVLTSWILMDYNALERKNQHYGRFRRGWRKIRVKDSRNALCGGMHYSNSPRQKVVFEVMTFSCTNPLYSAAQHFVISDTIH